MRAADAARAALAETGVSDASRTPLAQSASRPDLWPVQRVARHLDVTALDSISGQSARARRGTGRTARRPDRPPADPGRPARQLPEVDLHPVDVYTVLGERVDEDTL